MPTKMNCPHCAKDVEVKASSILEQNTFYCQHCNASFTPPPRYFECVVLQQDNSTRGIFERRYSTGELEYWSVLNLVAGVNGQPVHGQVPFKIEWEPSDHLPIGLFLWDNEAWDRENCRGLAWANLDSSMKAIEEGAKEQFMANIKQQMEAAGKKQAAGIVLANAAGRVVGEA